MKYFNCHAHIFNLQYVPENFLRVQFSPRIANAAHWILKKKAVSKVLLWILKRFIRKGTSAKMIAFLSIGLKKTQDMVFEDLLVNYPKEHEVKFIILPLDFKFMGAGDLNIPYEQQLDDLFEVKRKYPDRCYPFVAIDPRRGSPEENREFVRHYILKGFSGIKLYPALGFFSFHKGLEKVFEFAQEYNIPLMTHCSTGGINYVQKNALPEFINPDPFCKIQGKSYVFAQGNKDIGLYCDQFNNPEHFREALKCFSRLKICFAHLGLNAINKMGPDQGNTDVPLLQWYDTLLELMNTYPNVYADISYSIAYKNFCPWFLKRYLTWPPSVQDRILYGTDYFMTVQEVNGNDNEILKAALEGLGEPLFIKLANENVIRYLKTSIP